MKSIFIKSSLYSAAVLSLIVFIGGMLWTLVPWGGATMPHWVESEIGMSFTWSAMLVSLLLSITCVSSIAFSYSFQLLEISGQED